jgi:hypothetical protein
VAEGTYSSSLKLLDRCRRLRKPITFITRLRLDAALYKPAPPRRPAQIGRPRLKGRRLPNLSVVAEDPMNRVDADPGSRLLVRQAEAHCVEVVCATALWHSTVFLPAVPLRWVLIRDPPGRVLATQALFLCTDLHADPGRIISWFVRRWQMESSLFKRFVSAWGSRARGIGRRGRSRGPLLRSVGPFLCGHAVRPSAHGRRRRRRCPTNGLV